MSRNEPFSVYPSNRVSAVLVTIPENDSLSANGPAAKGRSWKRTPGLLQLQSNVPRLFYSSSASIQSTGHAAAASSVHSSSPGILLCKQKPFRLIVKTEDIGTELYATLTSDTFIFIHSNLKCHMYSPHNNPLTAKKFRSQPIHLSSDHSQVEKKSSWNRSCTRIRKPL